MELKSVKVIAFDLYNTLVEIQENNHFFLMLFKESQNGFGLDLPAYLKLVMTNNLSELIKILPPEFEQLYKQNEGVLNQELASVTVFQDVHEVLSNLKGHFRLFLISNLASPYKEPIFQLGLDKYFEGMIFSSDCGYLKPDKEIFETLEKATNNEPTEILMIGDSFKSDISGAKKRGWNFLKICRNGLLKNDFDIQGLHELEKRVF